MSIKAPTVMVSSTYYDLRQVRSDLADFITDIGYQPLLSEEPSFPVDPDMDTIENCRRRVEREADVLILVIGARYGNVEPRSEKSITNLEYLTARAKGIPVLAFAEKSLLNLLPFWKDNPDADFSSNVPDTRIFEFVETVRTAHKVWTYEFERGQDIVVVLRKQFAYLMREGLEALRLMQSPAERIPAGITGQALRLVLERPREWEYQLVTQVLADELERRSQLRMEQRFGLYFGEIKSLDYASFGPWAMDRLEEVRRAIAMLSDLVNVRLRHALRPSGTPGDAPEIVFVVQKIGEVYEQLLRFSQRVRSVRVPPCFQPVVDEFAAVPEQPLGELETKSAELTDRLAEALAAPREEGATTTIEVQMVFDLHNGDALTAALELAGEQCAEDMQRELDGDF